MKVARFSTAIAVFIVILGISASAQRTRRTTPRPAPRPTPVRQSVNPVVTAAKQQVSNQLYNVRVFVDRMGPIAVAIENADRDAAASRLKSDEIAANELNKKKIVAAIRGLRDGLITLETDFKTKPLLAAYLPKIQGISLLCAESEDSAIAGKFVESKDPLRRVALKLNETLAVMPGTLLPGSTTANTPARTVPVSTQNKPSPIPVQNPSTGKRFPAIGMSPSEVLQSTWGEPMSKRLSKTANGTTEVWTYSGKRTVYFYNGKVSNIVQ